MDIGTNAVRLLLVRFNPNRSYTILTRQREAVRLGEQSVNEARLKARKLERSTRPKSTEKVYEITLKNVDLPDLHPPEVKPKPAPSPADDADPAARGGSSYTIPSGVVTIRNHAFEDCPASLLNVSLSATVNNILNESFNGFGNTVTFASSSASGIQIYGGAFGSSIAPSLQIKVPPGSLGSYTGSTYFSPFTTHISEY